MITEEELKVKLDYLKDKNPKLITGTLCVNTKQKYGKNKRGIPSLRTETPNNGIAIRTAGTKPIKVLKMAVKVKAAIISLILIGAINKLVKFLLQISSRNIILKLILALNKKSYKIAAVKITPTVLL